MSAENAEPRYSREKLRKDPPDPPGFDRQGYEQALAATREALARPVDGSPSMAFELAELERLVRLYPQHARLFVDELPPPRRGR